MNSLPLFLGIGAAKSGTTWLGQYLSAHPQVGFSPVKELHYFDAKYQPKLCSSYNRHMKEKLIEAISRIGKSFTNNQLAMLRCLVLRDEMVENERRYLEYFELLREDSHRVLGEITPSYALLEREGFSEIMRLNSDTRFIFIMRDPVARYWSHLRFEETTFGKERFDAGKEVIERLKDPTYVMRTDYKRTLTELFAAVPRENVCIAFFETLMSPETHEKELKRITDFLGIDCLKANLSSKANQSASISLKGEEEEQIAEKFSGVYEYILEEFSDCVPDIWKRFLN